MTTSRDDSQISLRIALAAAGITAVGFLLYGVVVSRLSLISIPVFGEMLIKSFIVMLAIVFIHSRVQESFTLTNRGQIPFLSTIFFYCITIVLGYIGQVFFTVFQLFFGTHTTFMTEMKFFFWISEISVAGILNAILTAHVPYLVYFLFLRHQLKL